VHSSDCDGSGDDQSNDDNIIIRNGFNSDHDCRMMMKLRMVRCDDYRYDENIWFNNGSD
jgi:hypothetical protein